MITQHRILRRADLQGLQRLDEIREDPDLRAADEIAEVLFQSAQVNRIAITRPAYPRRARSRRRARDVAASCARFCEETGICLTALLPGEQARALSSHATLLVLTNLLHRSTIQRNASPMKKPAAMGQQC